MKNITQAQKNLQDRLIMLLIPFYFECALRIKKLYYFTILMALKSNISYVNIQNKHPST